MTKHIVEEVPVTTTNNAGAGLGSPKLPIKKDNIFKRYKKTILRNKTNIK